MARGRRRGVRVKEQLEALGLNAFAKLTGGKGLHVVVPVSRAPRGRPSRSSRARSSTRWCATSRARFVASMSKTKRGGKIFIDYLRNDAERRRSARTRRARGPARRSRCRSSGTSSRRTRRSRAAFGLLEVPRLIRARKRDPWAGFEARGARSSTDSAGLAQRRDQLVARHRAAARAGRASWPARRAPSCSCRRTRRAAAPRRARRARRARRGCARAGLRAAPPMRSFSTAMMSMTRPILPRPRRGASSISTTSRSASRFCFGELEQRAAYSSSSSSSRARPP